MRCRGIFAMLGRGVEDRKPAGFGFGSGVFLGLGGVSTEAVAQAAPGVTMEKGQPSRRLARTLPPGTAPRERPSWVVENALWRGLADWSEGDDGSIQALTDVQQQVLNAIAGFEIRADTLHRLETPEGATPGLEWVLPGARLPRQGPPASHQRAGDGPRGLLAAGLSLFGRATCRARRRETFLAGRFQSRPVSDVDSALSLGAGDLRLRRGRRQRRRPIPLFLLGDGGPAAAGTPISVSPEGFADF